MLLFKQCWEVLTFKWDLGETWYRGSGHMPEELCQVSTKSHYVSLALHSDPSPLQIGMFNCLSPIFISFISNLYFCSSPIFIFLAPAMLLVLEDLLPTPVLKINNHATGGWRTKDILGGPKSLETKKLGSSKGWEDQSAEKTNNWKDKKYITNRWDTKKLNILLKTETTVHCEIIHLWRGNLVCMCSYPC